MPEHEEIDYWKKPMTIDYALNLREYDGRAEYPYQRRQRLVFLERYEGEELDEEELDEEEEELDEEERERRYQNRRFIIQRLINTINRGEGDRLESREDIDILREEIVRAEGEPEMRRIIAGRLTNVPRNQLNARVYYILTGRNSECSIL
jgi:hypothetical protein